MQISPVPGQVPTTPLPQDTVKPVPQAQAPLATSIVQSAVDPSPRSEGGNKARTNGDRAKGGEGGGAKLGSSVNIRV